MLSSLDYCGLGRVCGETPVQLVVHSKTTVFESKRKISAVTPFGNPGSVNEVRKYTPGSDGMSKISAKCVDCAHLDHHVQESAETLLRRHTHPGPRRYDTRMGAQVPCEQVV